MPDAILAILKLCLIALLYLFIARVVRVVTTELTGPRHIPRPPPTPSRTATGAAQVKGLRLRVLEPEDVKGREFALGPELTVGRAPGCGVVLTEDTYVSQLHARVYTQNGQTYVEDLGSTNGTYVNKKKLSSAVRLRRGDRLQIGTTVMEVVR